MWKRSVLKVTEENIFPYSIVFEVEFLKNVKFAYVLAFELIFVLFKSDFMALWEKQVICLKISVHQ